MKIEDAIKRYESWAEDDRIDVLIRKEHRQMADWLKELKANRPQGDVDAVDILMREMHNVDQGYITIGEFDKRIEPLRHLCYGKPQGEWIETPNHTIKCSNCGAEFTNDVMDACLTSRVPFPKACPICMARMKGADDETN